MSKKSTRNDLDYAFKSRAARNCSVFRPKLRRWSSHTAEEPYNLSESGLKKEIPAQDEWIEKAKNISQAIHPGASGEKLTPAKIIFLTGDPLVLESRAIGLHKDTSADELRKQQDLLGHVYDPRYGGIAIIDTRDLSIAQVTKKIAYVIHSDSYGEFDMQKWIEDVIGMSIVPPVSTAAVGDNG